jgi:hypothetical protein
MLKLSVPRQDSAASARMETRPAHVKKWLTRLPVLNVVECMQTLHTTLADLNRCQLKPQARMELLELYRKPVQTAIRSLDSRQLGAMLPLSEKNKALAQQAREIQMEMAYGYKAAVLDLANLLPLGATAADLALPIHHGIRYLTQVLLKCYEVYAPVPPGVWNEIHQLYNYASELGVLREAVPDPLNRIRSNSHILAAYKHALLLGLCNPHQLPYRLINKIDLYLDRWANLAEFIDAGGNMKRKCQFVIQPDLDRPGTPCTGKPPEDPATSFQIFNTRPLVEKVHLQLTALSTRFKPEPEGLPNDFFDDHAKDMLRRLVLCWGISPARRFSRVAKEEAGELVVGIEAVNYFLNGGKPFELAHESSEEIEITLDAHSVSFVQPGLNVSDREHTKQSCHIVDEGPGGLALTILELVSVQLRVGDLIAVSHTDQPKKEWTVGLIRWARSTGADRVQIGVQRLAPTATAVAVQPVTTGNARQDFKLAVRLPELPALEQPQTLITPAGVFQPERNLFMETGNDLQMVRARRLLESTRAFEWFEYAVLDI